jgi:hypothetical protein
MKIDDVEFRATKRRCISAGAHTAHRASEGIPNVSCKVSYLIIHGYAHKVPAYLSAYIFRSTFNKTIRRGLATTGPNNTALQRVI